MYAGKGFNRSLREGLKVDTGGFVKGGGEEKKIFCKESEVTSGRVEGDQEGF